MSYKIGDKVWFAQRKSVTKTVECPDCFGDRFLTVIKGDSSQVTIGCAGCASGYEPPRGYISYASSEVDVTEVFIERKEETSLEVRYGFNGNYSAEDTEFFDTKEDAEARALELSDEYNKERLDEINRKDKHNRSWAWHVTYHSRMIKDARRDLVYHTEKLQAAKSKKKGKGD